MGKPLIIVESPAKARSMSRYLGNDFKALASYGHVRDLLPREGAVDPDNDFAMHYEIVERNKPHINLIVKEMRRADALYLATDPDREGEAISWHLYELLKQRKAIGDKPVYRVEFHEITKTAIQKAVANPRQISTSLIEAQQARRALDYLVGFNLSPLLWKKVRTGLSAGRVQSPALRMICEREAEIEKFVRREYWTIEADMDSAGQKFSGKLTHYRERKLTRFSITDEKSARQASATLGQAANGKLRVVKITKRQKKRNPAPPFTTSTLQQEASRKLGFSAKRTMQIAQQLYEGIGSGKDMAGLITYMRTDSVALASQAVSEIRDFIAGEYGASAVPESPRLFTNKSKNAQEAHEAIRPVSIGQTPVRLRSRLSAEQIKLYELIWKRTVACQMIPATIDTVSVDLAAGDAGVFRSSGSTIRIAGFMSVYLEGQDDRADKDEKETYLPSLREGMEVDLIKIRPQQHFTEPPPRYNEASLVKTLEAWGIGRPSTYASIISTLQNRQYVTLENRRFEPTAIGKIVNQFLSNHFTRYVDYEFTAKMEDELDEISRGEKQRIPLMRKFWDDFSRQVSEKEKTVSRDEVIQSRTLGVDPKSGKPLSVRMGRYGAYAQIGTRDDEEKPKFASLRAGQKLDSITFEQALGLFDLPRSLGESTEGEKLTVAIGRFGPYVKYGDKFVSLGNHDPWTVTRDTVLALVARKKEADSRRLIVNFEERGIQVLNGRYGPYVTDGEKNARVPETIEPSALKLQDCEELLKNAKPKPPSGKKKPGAKKTGTGGSAAKTAPRRKTTSRTTARRKTTRKTAAKPKATTKKTGTASRS